MTRAVHVKCDWGLTCMLEEQCGYGDSTVTTGSYWDEDVQIVPAGHRVIISCFSLL